MLMPLKRRDVVVCFGVDLVESGPVATSTTARQRAIPSDDILPVRTRRLFLVGLPRGDAGFARAGRGAGILSRLSSICAYEESRYTPAPHEWGRGQRVRES